MAEDLEVCHREAAVTASAEADTSLAMRAIAGTAEAEAIASGLAIHNSLLHETFARRPTSIVVGRAGIEFVRALTTRENRARHGTT